ncbi:tRNA modification GTPase MnmE [Clostridium sp. CAG:465]|nr:tRNA modification GTPase MnmE [Clostridium sp. CAG:465]
MSTDTIAAIGTALSNSGISIIRISGKDSLNIIRKIFVSNSKIMPNNIIYGKIVENGKVVDTVLVSYFKNPKSYTGEDVCEINCHGGVQITREILQLVLANGARLAEPGEFSKRAFLNGKMDLTKAEAVINLINSKNTTQARIAANNLEGDLYKKIKEVREELIELMAHIEVSVDYPEYDYDEVENDNVISLLNKKIIEINNILSTYEQGKYIKDGVNVVILGKPNVGKSSLLNTLSRSQKAIVTEIPGTTRDVIEERINIGNIILNLSDTAGIRKTDDFVEKIGVKRSIEKIDEADLVIYLLNVESDIDDEDKEILSKIQNKGIKLITVINKIDKGQKLKFDSILDELKRFGVNEVIKMSVLNNEGIDELKNKIEEIFNTNDLDFENELIITNERHRDLLNKSKEYLEIAKKEIENNEPIDIVSIVIKNATKSLGEIIGADVNQDIVNKIFEKFCLGK